MNTKAVADGKASLDLLLQSRLIGFQNCSTGQNSRRLFHKNTISGDLKTNTAAGVEQKTKIETQQHTPNGLCIR